MSRFWVWEGSRPDVISGRGDIARVSRLSNTPHHSGLFCIPLTIRDLHRSEGYIRNLSRQLRYDIDLDVIIKDNNQDQ